MSAQCTAGSAHQLCSHEQGCKSWRLTFHSPHQQGICYHQRADAWPSTVLVCKKSAIAKVLTFDLPQSSSARNQLSPKCWHLTFHSPCLQGIWYHQQQLECWHYRNASLYSLELEFVTALKSGTWKRSLIVWHMKETIKCDTGLLAMSTFLVCKGSAIANNRARTLTHLQHFCVV